MILDADSDGYGDPDNFKHLVIFLENYVENDLDCDDTTDQNRQTLKSVMVSTMTV